jgi:malate/lactate dehydrogenase
MKLGIIGAGAVGSASLLSLVMRGSACEIVVIDRNRKRPGRAPASIDMGMLMSSPGLCKDLAYSHPAVAWISIAACDHQGAAWPPR